jgi:translocation and assembly module TamB
MQADGDLAGQPLKLAGRFARDAEGSLSVPTFEGHWASAAIDIANLAITKTSTTGSGHVSMTRLQDLAAVNGMDLGGSINLDIATDQQAAGTVRGKLRGQGLRSGGIGITTLEADTTVSDPLGRAATKATGTLSGLSGIADIGRLAVTMNGDRQALDVTLQAAGVRTNGALTARIEPAGPEVRIALSRFNGRYGEIPVDLAATARARVSGAHVAIDPASFQLGGSRVTLSGIVDPAASDLVIDIAGMPLAIIEAFAPGSGVSGALQAKLHLRGPLASPLIDATYNASGIKMRRPETMFLPPLAVTGTAAVAGRQASIDAKLSAGTNSSLSVKGKGTLPQGRAPLSGSTSITGAIDLAPFAPLSGPTVQGVTGRLQSDLNFTVSGETITGGGTLNLTGAALNLPKTGLRLDHGEASLALHGNSLQIQRLRFQTAGNGEVTASGSLSLDAAHGFPTDLRVETRRALLVSRTDLIATVSSTLKLTGSTRDGLDLSGPVTIDKAEIAIGAPQVVDYPTVPVREINVPGLPNQSAPPSEAPSQPPAAAASPSRPIKLNITVEAPRAIFVRGRGLDAEVGGQFRVTGDVAKPIVLGSLSLRRGDFTLAGRRLSFTRGNVALVTVDTLDPLLDFLATTQAGSTTINLAITGTPRAPKIELTSTPTLPPDEAMALLLFGKVGSALSPFELLQAAQALAELTGVSPGSSLLSKLRSGLGLDRLSINSSDNSSRSGPASSSIEAGRYVSPGVYVGTKQGASPGSSRGTVEIDVFPHVKLNGDVGADSNGRIGAKMEWDY